MALYFFIFAFIISFVTLGIASGMVSRSFVKLSHVIGINEQVTSFVLIGVATSLPELFVAIASFIAKVPLASVGNIIGANLANLTLALGLVVYLSDGIELRDVTSKKIFWSSFMLALLPAILVVGGGISRLDGFILLSLFVLYFVLFATDSEYFKRSTAHVPFGVHFFSDTITSLWDFATGLLLLILSSIFIVFFGVSLAQYLSMDLLFFGVLFLGLITTLPELLFGIRSALLRHPSFAMGNLMASVVFNSTVTLGILSIFSPTIITSVKSFVSVNLIFTFIAFFFLSIFSYTGSKITRQEGLLLILIYILYFLSAIFL